MMNLSELLFSANVAGITRMLQQNPSLANSGIPLPDNPAAEHPLHRICDGVFRKNYSEETGIAIAGVFLSNGAKVNVDHAPGKDSPLTAACSLRCDKLALLYLDLGADIRHPGCHGGTALHWAAWCGRDSIVKKLLTLNPEINQRCIDFKSTPLFWALHGYKFGGKENLHHQVSCARMLLEHGADPSIPNFEGYVPKQLIGKDDTALMALFQNL